MKIERMYEVHNGSVVEVINAIPTFDNREEAELEVKRSMNFEVGGLYRWASGKEARWYQSFAKYGALKCVHVGVHQGGFTSLQEAGLFENTDSLHIIATAHLRSGEFIRIG